MWEISERSYDTLYSHISIERTLFLVKCIVNNWLSSIPDAAEPPKEDAEQKTEEEKKKRREEKKKMEKKKDSEQEKTEAGKPPDGEQKVSITV